MDLAVSPDGWLSHGARRWRCALGRAGIRPDKHEGDGATPVGRFALRSVLYRPDRIARPVTSLAVRPIVEGDGWCDAPGHPDYNRPVRLPHPASCETMWRDDGLYDLVVVLGHNDDPPEPGRGSAIFLHVARPDYAPTEGCVALALADLVELLTTIDRDDAMVVLGPAAGVAEKAGQD
jgi:L,D-peptidoglycan transpeptidase YkuD (ErfK/YbiS/YcfS/YnhG family)